MSRNQSHRALVFVSALIGSSLYRPPDANALQRPPIFCDALIHRMIHRLSLSIS